MSRLQPRPKAPATSNISSQEPVAGIEAQLDRPKRRNISADGISDRATLILIRRTLCTHLGDKGKSTPTPIDEILPPLTSSNEVDLQLYALIAIIIREFVQTWYGKITPDQVFVEEVVKIIAHCTRALEQRVRQVDLESLLFDELPELLEVHIEAYRASHQNLHPPPFEHISRQTYHSLWPFPALAPVPAKGQNQTEEQSANESAYRQLLIHGLLVVLLPTEDLQNDCLNSVFGQILAEMILGGGIGGKASEPWLLWEGITKIAEVIEAQMPKSKAKVRVERSKSSAGTSKTFDPTGQSTRSFKIRNSVQKSFWLILQYGFLVFTTIRFFIVTFATSSSLPSRIAHPMKMGGGNQANENVYKERPHLTLGSETTTKDQRVPSKQPLLKMKIWSCAASLLDLHARMPWLSATLSILQWGALVGPGEIGNTDGMIDKIISHAIQTHVLSPLLLPQLLRIGRAALFPNNTLAPPRVIPSVSEQLTIRRRAAEAILDLIPLRMQDVYFGDGMGRRIREVEEVLDVFGDSYCNKHILYGVVELIIVRLIPEMADKGIEELLGDRLS